MTSSPQAPSPSPTSSSRYGSKDAALDIAYSAVFAALIISLAFVSIPTGTSVPIVLQNGACILAGLILGPRRGLLAVTLFLGIGFFLPVLSGGHTVTSALGGPTIGYLVGYLVSPFVAGLIVWLSPRHKPNMIIGYSIAAIVAVALQYTCGSIGMAIRTDISLLKALTAQVIFIIPDAIKCVAAVLIAISVHTAFPDLRGKSKQSSATTSTRPTE